MKGIKEKVYNVTAITVESLEHKQLNLFVCPESRCCCFCRPKSRWVTLTNYKFHSPTLTFVALDVPARNKVSVNYYTLADPALYDQLSLI